MDLRMKFPGARDQGPRPTCLAFAMSDAHMLVVENGALLSADYLHFHAAQRAKVPLSAGVGLSSMRDALVKDGQPSEDDCPYSQSRSDAWAPPAPTNSIWTRSSSVLVGKPSDLLQTALSVGRANVLVLRISRSFHAPDRASHVVSDDGGKDRRFHAVVVVGLATIDGDLAFLARNSWGPGWGFEGHAWLPHAYVDARGVYVVELEVQAP